MTRLTINGLNYNVLTWGQGIPLVLLHGFTGNAAGWAEIAEPLSQQYRVIAIDIIGHGESDKPSSLAPYQMPNAACDLYRLVQSLTAAPVHLLGYSMGGRLALYLACHFPELFRSLILESASPGLTAQADRHERQSQDDALADRIEQDGIAAFVNYWENLPLWASQKTLTQPVLQAQHEQRLNNSPVGLANSLRGMGTGVQPALWDYLPNLKLPVQLIAGALDNKFVQINHEMARLLPDANLCLVASAGHNTHTEKPGDFVKIVLNHLSRVV